MVNLKRLSVLVVEDTKPMLEIMVAVLETIGIGRILTASHGKRGFEVFCKEAPDIVLTDWHMEPPDGIELTRQIRTHALSPNRMTPVIMITGFSTLDRIGRARDAGVTEFIIKPFSANDLAKRLAHVINKPRDFIDAPGFFGPDRRRRAVEGYAGPFRRERDPKSDG